MSERKYQCAVITGASAGLGEEFAKQLAGDCGKVILVARRKERLRELADRLSSECREVDCRPVDLSKKDERDSLVKELAGEKVDLLINNAGLGDYGDFLEGEWSKLNVMLQVNIVALTHLCREFGKTMVANGGGEILNVSSVASTLPIPDFAAYAASKAYVSSLSEAIRLEFREKGVKVTALCPGPVHTEFGSVAAREGGEKEFGPREMIYVDKEKVVRDALDALKRGKARIFPGALVSMLAHGVGAMPMALIRLIMGRRPRRV